MASSAESMHHGSRESTTAYFTRVRSLTLELCKTLAPEDTVVQTMPDVSPTKWHLAHVTWFFERFVLRQHVDGYKQFNDAFDYLFNSYYYTAGQMHARPRRGLLSRPTLDEVIAYRRHVDDAMLDVIAANDGDEELKFLVTLGLNHEQQHQELLLTDIKHVMSCNPLKPAVNPALPVPPSADAGPVGWIDGENGIHRIGANDTGFCFDNETPRHDALLHPHLIADRLVTNGEFREFVEDGAYDKAALWLSDGWSTINEQRWRRPLYWSEDLQSEFTLAGERDIDPNAPVCHVSFYEADAYARWAGARLPTEFEWERAASAHDVAGNLLDSGYWHPVNSGDSLLNSLPADGRLPNVRNSVNCPPNPPADGRLPNVGNSVNCPPNLQFFGDVWEWTSSAYAPYPGFRPLAGSLGEYNGKFMCNQVTVRGGSCVTSRDHIRASYRSFFYPDARWQFLGFRLTKDADG